MELLKKTTRKEKVYFTLLMLGIVAALTYVQPALAMPRFFPDGGGSGDGGGKSDTHNKSCFMTDPETGRRIEIPHGGIVSTAYRTYSCDNGVISVSGP